MWTNKAFSLKRALTQGDPLVMAIYATAIRPLIDKVKNNAMQTWFADDAAAAGNIEDLKEWWENLSTRGPDYGYFPNALKSVIVVKPDKLEKATETFRGLDAVITTERTRYLGAPIGSEAFVTHFIEGQVSGWVNKIKQVIRVQKLVGLPPPALELLGRLS